MGAHTLATPDCPTSGAQSWSSTPSSAGDVFRGKLIPYNPTGMFEGSSRQAIDAFKSVLDLARIPATVRLTRRRDIEAACGQFAVAR